MSRKATIDALFGAKPAPAPERKAAGDSRDAPKPGEGALGAPNEAPADRGETAAPSGRVLAGAIGAMGVSLQQLKESAREAEALRQAMTGIDRVVQLDPALIDAAPVADRFRQGDDEALLALAESIRRSGQQVPVLVRPHPSAEGRWQAAYGHRRIRAAALVGVPVKAIVRPLTDAELAVAQGKENLERRDLSFIEKAFFALGLERAGFDRATITEAVGADKADVSRYLSIARAVPENLAHVIGAAPRTGRARWQELADALAARRAQAPTVADLCAWLPQLDAYLKADSDGRFRLAMARLSAAPAAAPQLPPLLSAADGRPLVLMKGKGKRRRFDVDEEAAPGFSAFVAEALPELYRRWRKAGGEPKS
jgi:ParB family chromosome partitioning protein